MLSGLYFSAAIIGLAASPHCLTMCSALCEKSAQHCELSHQAKPLGMSKIYYYLPVLMGRLISYVVAGALLSLFTTTALNFLSSIAWLKPIWLFSQIAIVLVGLWMLVTGYLPLSISNVTQSIRSFLGINDRHVLPKTSGIYAASAYSLLAGSLWALIPCGVLHSVLLMAALANSPLEGGMVMLSFGLTSSLSLIIGGWLWSYLMARRKTGNGNFVQNRSGSENVIDDSILVKNNKYFSKWVEGTLSYRIAGLAVVIAGAWSVYRMLMVGLTSGSQCG
jgi:sulfite exporter TauE/SafE